MGSEDPFSCVLVRGDTIPADPAPLRTTPIRSTKHTTRSLLVALITLLSVQIGSRFRLFTFRIRIAAGKRAFHQEATKRIIQTVSVIRRSVRGNAPGLNFSIFPD